MKETELDFDVRFVFGAFCFYWNKQNCGCIWPTVVL